MKACYFRQSAIIQLFLSYNCINLTVKDEKGGCALHNAVFGPKGGNQIAKKGGNSIEIAPGSSRTLIKKGC
jgi:hypothetical protein